MFRRRRRATHSDQVEATRDYLETLLDNPTLDSEQAKRINWTLRSDRRVRRLASSAYEQFEQSVPAGAQAGIMDFFEWLIENQDSIFAFIARLISLFGGLGGLAQRGTVDPLDQ